MGRPVHEAQHLLDNEEQNIGNSTTLIPENGVATTIPRMSPPRILQLSGPSQKGQTTSIIFTASRLVGAQNPNPGFAGPVTGIVEFGNGGRSTSVEFDVPFGPFIGSFTGAAAASEPNDGGVIVTVPTGVLRAYTRYDNLLIQPILGIPSQSLATLNGVAFNGPGGTYPNGIPGRPRAEPVAVKVMAAYFTHRHHKVYRTQYCYIGGVVAIPANSIYCIPAFARAVKVLRNAPSANLTVSIFDENHHLLEQYSLGALPSPTISLTGTAAYVALASPGPGDNVTFLALSYEIGI
jgi:hypothetical protein